MDSKQPQTASQHKTKIFVLTPDKIKQLGISNLLKQFQVPKTPTNSTESTSKDSTSNDDITDPSQGSVTNDETNDKTEPTQTDINTPNDEIPKISKKLGLSMKNKLSSILLKEDIKPKISEIQENEDQNQNKNQGKHIEERNIEALAPQETTPNLAEIKEELEIVEWDGNVEPFEESNINCGQENLSENITQTPTQSSKVLQDLDAIEQLIKSPSKQLQSTSEVQQVITVEVTFSPNRVSIPNTRLGGLKSPKINIKSVETISEGPIQNIRLGGLKSPLKPSESVVNSLKSVETSMKPTSESPVQNIRLGGLKSSIMPSENETTTIGGLKSPIKPSESVLESLTSVETLIKPLSEGPRIESARLGGFKKNFSSETFIPIAGTSSEVAVKITNAKTTTRLSSLRNSNVLSNKIVETDNPLVKNEKIAKLKNIISDKMKETEDLKQGKVTKFRNILNTETTTKGVKISKFKNILSEKMKQNDENLTNVTIKEEPEIRRNSRRSSRTRKSTFTNKDYVWDSSKRNDSESDLEDETEAVESEEDAALTTKSRPRRSTRSGRSKLVKEESNSEDPGENDGDIEMDLDESQDLQDDSFVDDLQKTDQPKRKIGRPRRVITESERNVPKIKRKIGRPKKEPQNEESQMDDTETSTNENDLKRKLEDSDTESLSPKKRLRHVRKISSDKDSDFNDSDDSDIPLKSYKKKYTPVAVDRRYRKAEKLVVTEEEFKDALEKLNVTMIGKKSNARLKEEADLKKKVNAYFMNMNSVTCGKCNKEMEPKLFALHNNKAHYNLGWRIGEPEIDTNDEKKCMCILLAYLKNKESTKYLTCETCGNAKKSAAGYLSHINTCQKSPEELLKARVTCSLCGKSYARSSIKIHLATYHVKLSDQIKITDFVEGEELVGEDGNRKKRKAAEKATNLIQEVIKLDPDIPSSRTFKDAYRPSVSNSRKILCVGLLRRLEKEFTLEDKVSCKFQGCKYLAENLEELKAHIEECKEKYIDSYICRYCLFVTKTNEQYIEHVKEEHTNLVVKKEVDNEFEEEEDEFAPPEDYDLDENNILSINDFSQIKNHADKPRKHKLKYKVHFLTYNRCGPTTQNIIYPAAFKWTLELVAKHYSDVLFPNAFSKKSYWNLLNKTEKSKYLPINKLSMEVETIKQTLPSTLKDNQGTERNWKKYKLFESEVHNDAITIYCGGPIWAMAWAPTDSKKINDQFLAVSCLREHNRNFLVEETSSTSEMIQFWNFGPIINKTKLSDKPKLEFCLAHNHGNVWCMEWCPSGCFNDDLEDDKLTRIGLLALACSDGSLPIYAISKDSDEMNAGETDTNEEMIEAEDKSTESEENIDDAMNLGIGEVKIYKTKLAFKLIISDNADEVNAVSPYQCVKISWTKYKEHKVIAAGYSNGIVALWDLSSQSPLLCSEEDGVTVLRPYQLFKAHNGPVTALCLSILENGKKWLFTGSYDKTAKYWNLEDTTHPSTISPKNLSVMDASWLSHWMVTFAGYDDSTFYQNTNATIQSIRNFMCDQYTAFPQHSPIMSTSSNDWGNQFALSTFAGELGVMFLHQLLTNTESRKTDKTKRIMVTYSELVDKTLTPDERLKKIDEKKPVVKKGGVKKEETQTEDLDQKDIIKEFMNKKENTDDSEELTYEEAQSRYGLVFNDLNMDSKILIPEISKRLRRSNLMYEAPVMMYPLMSINRTVWNPNKQAFLYIASGYNTGFVRVHCIRHMNNVYIEKECFKFNDYDL